MVGFHAAQPAAEALPRRAAGARMALDFAQRDVGVDARLELVFGHAGDAGRGVTGQRLVAQRTDDRPGPRSHPARGLKRIADVAQELGVFPAHDVRVGPGDETGRGQVCGDSTDQVVGAARIAARVEDTADRRGMVQHQARLQIRRRHPDHHAVHPVETAQRHALVVHAVLRAHHRQVFPTRGPKGGQRRVGVLRLHRQQDDVIVTKIDLARMADRGDRQPHAFPGRFGRQSPALDDTQMCTAADEPHIAAVLQQPRADDPADSACPIDDVSHAASRLVVRSPQ